MIILYVTSFKICKDTFLNTIRFQKIKKKFLKLQFFDDFIINFQNNFQNFISFDYMN